MFTLESILKVFLESSGEHLFKIWKTLKQLLIDQIADERVNNLESVANILRRDANIKRPVKQQAADAISLADLEKILERARHAKISLKERIALDVLTIVFSTMSRVAEIAALEVRDVKEDGPAISIRPKTFAGTWRRLVKRVVDVGGLRPSTMLRKWRNVAVRAQRTRLFPARGGAVEHISSATITTNLRSVIKKLGLGIRVTSHSGRKGAALESLLAGVPLVAIQAFGGWRDIASMERYVGDAIRKNIAVGELLGQVKSYCGWNNNSTKHMKLCMW